MNTSENESSANSNAEFENKNQLGTGAGKLVEPARHGRGDMGAGGGRGFFKAAAKGSKVKQHSTRGGASVVATLAQRTAELGKQLIECPAGWRCPFGSSVEPSAVAGLFGGLPAVGNFAELQGQMDLSRCSQLVQRLKASMLRDGRAMSDSTAEDAASAGLLALARWRACNARHLGARVRGTAAAVAWRAIVRAVAADGLGGGVESFAPDVLTELRGSALPLPALVGDDSRADRASRLLFERARAGRLNLLQRRLDSLAGACAGKGSSKRRESILRLGVAFRRLLLGDDLDNAASAAGFVATVSNTRGGGTMRAGDKLLRAARRLGFAVQFDARIKGQTIARPDFA